MSKLWILKTKGEKSAFGGNTGYDDNPMSHYAYDTTVKNHDKIKVGDYVLVADKKHIIGYAQIESIKVQHQVRKIRYSCPICGINEFYFRKKLDMPYRCRNKHEFAKRTEREIIVDNFTAFYGDSFVKWEASTSVKALDNFYIKRNKYYSIQAANIDFLETRLREVEVHNAEYTEISKVQKIVDVTVIPDYIHKNIDERHFKLRELKLRAGQLKFKNDLIDIYGPVCMISEIFIPVTIQASHIIPYRGKRDNNPRNGLLLRADLHLLYDSDLIGINPITFEIKLHPEIRKSYYEQYEGKVLKTRREDFHPSNEALAFRWKKFQLKIKEND